MAGRLRRIGFRAGLVNATVGPPRVLDYSGWRPTDANLDEMVAAGIVGVSRYLSLPDQDWKVIHKPEYDRTLAHGLSIVLNWEYQKGSALGGYSLGQQHGAEARRQARALGHPDERPITQSLDVDYTAAQRSAALEYQRGFNDGGGCGQQGIYGPRDIIDSCFAAGLIRVGWQTAATSWGPVPGVSNLAAIIQRVAKSYPQWPPNLYDQNDIVLADWGQHPRPGIDARHLCLFGYRCPWAP